MDSSIICPFLVFGLCLLAWIIALCKGEITGRYGLFTLKRADRPATFWFTTFMGFAALVVIAVILIGGLVRERRAAKARQGESKTSLPEPSAYGTPQQPDEDP